MLVTEARLRVDLTHGQADGTLRAGVDAGEAGVAALSHHRVAYRRAARKRDAARRTHSGTDATADAFLRVDSQEIVERLRLELEVAGQELLMRSAVLVVDRFNPMFVSRDIVFDLQQVAVDVLLGMRVRCTSMSKFGSQLSTMSSVRM